ncbi:hypothetical protein [Derxia lacustris]|uniref:hypothetical protein n=1 Tax=Derxia lacustris TaxID=764842 RepID=UPI00111BD20B|nr:hypothetical protein [Derxia lacustris]
MQPSRSALVDQALNWFRTSEESARETGAPALRPATGTPGRLLRPGHPERSCVVLDLTPETATGAELALLLAAGADRDLGFAGRHASFTAAVAEAAAVVVTCDDAEDLIARVAGWRIASPQLAVVVALHRVDTAALRALFSAGIGDFVLAPFDGEQLRARLDAAIARAGSRSDQPGGEWPLMVATGTLGDESFRQLKGRIVASFERGYIEGMLRRSAGNISQSARLARKNRRAFFELIKKHEIDVAGFRDADLGLPGD